MSPSPTTLRRKAELEDVLPREWAGACTAAELAERAWGAGARDATLARPGLRLLLAEGTAIRHDWHHPPRYVHRVAEDAVPKTLGEALGAREMASDEAGPVCGNHTEYTDDSDFVESVDPVHCAACGKLHDPESSIYPTEDAGDEVPVCERCADQIDGPSGLAELRRRVALRAKGKAKGRAKAAAKPKARPHDEQRGHQLSLWG